MVYSPFSDGIASPGPALPPGPSRPDRFLRDQPIWQGWLTDPEADPGLATALDRIDREFAEGRGGLDRGERALVALAAARRTGSIACAAAQAAATARLLPEGPAIADLLLEEGLPSPLTGRRGALVAAAGALTASPSRLYDPVHRAEIDRLDAEEVVDLIFIAARASHRNRLRLTLGESLRPTPGARAGR